MPFAPIAHREGQEANFCIPHSPDDASSQIKNILIRPQFELWNRRKQREEIGGTTCGTGAPYIRKNC